MEAVHRILGSQTSPLTLSPIGDVLRPTSLKLSNTQTCRRLLSDLFLNRAPILKRHKGLFNRFLYRSSILKMEADVARGFDVSVVLYPAGISLASQGTVMDQVGRIYKTSSNGKELPELEYATGRFDTKSQWIMEVGARLMDRRDHVRFFYSLIRRIAFGRIRVAGTIGFGLWDSLWMSFSFKKAQAMLHDDPEFVHTVFKHWTEYHCMTADAMLDAGIKIIFLRENPNGFPPAGGLAEYLDPLVSDYYTHICKSVRARGGCVILDCDADDMIETGLPTRWGFDGIGPLRFRDMEDLIAARKAIDERLYLIGSLAVPSGLEGSPGTGKRTTGIMLTSKPMWRVRFAADEYDPVNADLPILAEPGNSPIE